MKTFLTPVAALSVLSGVILGSNGARAQAWMDIARQPVPSFSASRGYTGDHSYFGPEMYIPGNLGNPLPAGGSGVPMASGDSGGPIEALVGDEDEESPLVELVEDLAEDLDDCD
jgi:hypothetical protein